MILHIDMDAFFASIEQAINPRLKGKPIIVGSRGNKMHTVVCAASYEAKALGISSGMPTAEAFRIYPKLLFVPADQTKYIWTSERILNLLKAYGMEIEYPSIDEFRMDIGKYPDPLSLAREIQSQIKSALNITASIGIAQNCLLAKLASKLKKPNGITIITPENLYKILKDTPVDKLCGIGQKTTALLRNLGIQTALDLYEKPPDFLKKFLGKYGTNFYISLHLKQRLEPQTEEEKAKSIGHSYTFPETSENTGFIYAWIRLLSEMVSSRMRADNLLANTVRLWLNSPQTGGFCGQETSKIATNDGFEVYLRCLKIMASSGLKKPKIRALGVTCAGLSKKAYTPFLKEEKSREGLIKAVDRINKRFGDDSIYPAVISLTRKMLK
jgi:DNA polymerase IV